MLSADQIRENNRRKIQAQLNAQKRLKQASSMLQTSSNDLTGGLHLTQQDIMTSQSVDAQLSQKLSPYIQTKSLIDTVLSDNELTEELKRILVTMFDIEVKPKLMQIRNTRMSVNQFQAILVTIAKQLLNKTNIVLEKKQPVNVVDSVNTDNEDMKTPVKTPSKPLQGKPNMIDDDSISKAFDDYKDMMERIPLRRSKSEPWSPTVDNQNDLQEINEMINTLVDANKDVQMLTDERIETATKATLLTNIKSLFNKDRCNLNIYDSMERDVPQNNNLVRNTLDNMHGLTSANETKLRIVYKRMRDNMQTYLPVKEHLHFEVLIVKRMLKELIRIRGLSKFVGNSSSSSESASAAAVEGSGVGKMQSAKKVMTTSNGKYLIDVYKLVHFNILELRYKSNRHLVYPSKIVSKLMAFIILEKVINDRFDSKYARQLGVHESYLLTQLLPYIDLDWSDLKDNESYSNRFEVLLGEIRSGNTNREIKREAEQYLKTALHTKRISKRDFDMLMAEINN